MTTEPFDAKVFIQGLLNRGWRWSDAEHDRLLHPENYDFYLRYDEPTDRLTVSPQLDEHLKLVIPTPRSKGRLRR